MVDLDLRVSLQDFHVAEAPEGSVHQAAEAVPLHLERAKSVEAVEGQALHTADAVPAQLPGMRRVKIAHIVHAGFVAPLITVFSGR